MRGAQLRGYKKPDALAERAGLLDLLAQSFDFEAVKDAAIKNHDCMDATAMPEQRGLVSEA